MRRAAVRNVSGVHTHAQQDSSLAADISTPTPTSTVHPPIFHAYLIARAYTRARTHNMGRTHKTHSAYLSQCGHDFVWVELTGAILVILVVHTVRPSWWGECM